MDVAFCTVWMFPLMSQAALVNVKGTSGRCTFCKVLIIALVLRT